MNDRESPLLDPTSMRILETAYLVRPRSEEALRAALREPPQDLGERVDALARAGFVERSANGLEFVSPYATFVAMGRERARAMHEETLRTTALMQALPSLIRAWDLSEVEEGGEHPLAVNIIHALADSSDAWFKHAFAEEPSRPSMTFPEATALEGTIREGHLVELQSRLNAASVRVLVHPAAPIAADLAVGIEDAREAGVEFRLSRHVESWLYVDAESIVGVPILWGSGSPANVLAIRTPPVVAAMAMLFDRLWERAADWNKPDPPWSAVLALLAQGMTDDAIADALKLTTRTVRRRIAEAMAELGATSRFTLGAEWSARRSST